MGWTWAAALAAVIASGVCAQAPQTQRWIVTFDPRAKASVREAALAQLGATVVAHLASDGNTDNEISATVAEFPSEIEAPPVRGREILAVEPDRRWKWIEGRENSFLKPVFAVEPSLGAALVSRPEAPWGVNRVHAPAAWNITQGAGADVAVIDTGIDLAHPDLLDKVDGGYSALTKTENPADYQDDNGHGTHVAGTLAAARDGKGVVGVAPRARLYSVKVLDAEGSGRLSDVIDGILWTAKNGAKVANLSLAIPVDSPALHQAIKFARAKGVVLIAASGNSGGPVEFPAAYPEVVAVSASDSSDRRALFSSHGREVSFIAPGVDVVSDRLGGGVTAMSGTSMAAPHVSGLAALAVSLGWTGATGPDGVIEQLKKAARPLHGLGRDEQGSGQIDAGKLAR